MDSPFPCRHLIGSLCSEGGTMLIVSPGLCAPVNHHGSRCSPHRNQCFPLCSQGKRWIQRQLLPRKPPTVCHMQQESKGLAPEGRQHPFFLSSASWLSPDCSWGPFGHKSVIRCPLIRERTTGVPWSFQNDQYKASWWLSDRIGQHHLRRQRFEARSLNRDGTRF